MPREKPLTFTAGALFDQDGAPVEAARHPQMEVRTRLPVCAPPRSYLRKKRVVSLPGHAAEREGV